MSGSVLRGLHLIEIPLDLPRQLIKACVEQIGVGLLARELPCESLVILIHAVGPPERRCREAAPGRLRPSGPERGDPLWWTRLGAVTCGGDTGGRAAVPHQRGGQIRYA